MKRAIILPADERVAYVEETVENLERFDPCNESSMLRSDLRFWKRIADGSVEAAVSRRGREMSAEAIWPVLQDPRGKGIDLRVFSGHGNTWLMDRTGPRVWGLHRRSERALEFHGAKRCPKSSGVPR